MDIKVQLDALTIGDLERMDAAARGEVPMSQLIDLLDRVVVGGVRHLPLTALSDIIAALSAAIAEMSNPKN
jgi:hypothetical protein